MFIFFLYREVEISLQIESFFSITTIIKIEKKKKKNNERKKFYRLETLFSRDAC